MSIFKLKGCFSILRVRNINLDINFKFFKLSKCSFYNNGKKNKTNFCIIWSVYYF